MGNGNGGEQVSGIKRFIFGHPNTQATTASFLRSLAFGIRSRIFVAYLSHILLLLPVIGLSLFPGFLET